jgi:hypothetical protein
MKFIELMDVQEYYGFFLFWEQIATLGEMSSPLTRVAFIITITGI